MKSHSNISNSRDTVSAKDKSDLQTEEESTIKVRNNEVSSHHRHYYHSSHPRTGQRRLDKQYHQVHDRNQKSIRIQQSKRQNEGFTTSNTEDHNNVHI